MAEAGGHRLPFAWRSVAVFLAAAALLAVFGSVLVLDRRHDLLRQGGEELLSIADLKDFQIERWLQERRDDGKAIQLTPTALFDVPRFLAGGGGAGLRERIATWLASKRLPYSDYRGAFLLDTTGRVLLADAEEGADVCPEVARQATEVARAGGVAMTDLHRSGGGKPHLGILAAVGAPPGQAAPAVVFVWIDPEEYLFPLLQRWPTPSRSGETLLVRREGEEILFLNELRHRAGTALALRLPVADEDLPAAMAARGVAGEVVGRDYRGVAVVATILPVAGTPWLLVAKEDEAEILAPLARIVGLTFGLMAALCLAVGLGLLLVRRGRETAFYRERMDEERRRVAAEERYRQLFEATSSAVVIYEAVDGGEDFIIRECNAAAERIEDVRRGDVVGRRVTEAFPGVHAFGLLEVFRSVFRDGEPRRHPVSHYRDGRIEGWRENRVFRLPGGEIVAIYDDVTERKHTEDALRRSEERYRTVVETALEAVWFLDRNFVTTDVNDAAVRMLGFGREELVGRPFLDLVVEEDRPIQAEEFERRRRGESGRYERRVRCKDGSLKWLLISARALLDDAGVFVGTIGLISDITERKRAEEELRESEERYRRIIELSNEGIWAMDAGHRTTFVNPRMCELLGYDEQEMIGKLVEELFFEEDLSEHRNQMHERHAGKPGSYERRFRRKDGSELWASVSAVPLTDPGGTFDGSFAMFTDITERRKAEGLARQLGEMVDAAPSSITIHTFDGRFLYANQSTFDLHGYTREEFLALPLSRIDVPGSNERFEERIRRLRERGEASFEVGHRRKDGTVIPLMVDARIVSWMGESAILSVATDITERKAAEKKLENYSGDLERLVEERTRELERVHADLFATAKLTAMGRMGAGLAHQLNSPLGGATLLVDGLIDAFREEHPAETQRLRDVREALGRMHDIIECMLTLSMMPRRGRAPRTTVDLSAAIGTILDLAEHDCAAKGVRQERRLAAGLPAITVRPGELDQVFLNLVNNALDAMPEGGVLTVEVRAVPDAVEVRVADTGEGVPKENLDKIFEPFFTTRRKRRGVGLGLSVVHDIVARYAGEIRVDSEVGKGTTFTVRIPMQGLGDEETPQPGGGDNA